MRRYSIVGEQNVPASVPLAADGSEADASIVGILGATTVRPHIYYIALGCPATPVEAAVAVELSIFSAVGTWTTVVPELLDSAEPAAGCSGRSNSTVAPTYTADTGLWRRAFNQRASVEWWEDPERGIVLAASATAGAGLWFKAATSAGALYYATMHHAEI